MSPKKPRSTDFRKLLRGEMLREPPVEALQAAFRIFRDPRSEMSAQPSWVGSIAVLFDSFREPLPEGVRSGTGDERRLLLALQQESGEDLQVDLQVRAEGETALRLVGQLLPPAENATARCVADGATLSATSVGDGGEFVLTAPRSASERAILEIGIGPDARWELPGVLASGRPPAAADPERD